MKNMTVFTLLLAGVSACLEADSWRGGDVRILGVEGELGARSRVADLVLVLDGAVEAASGAEECAALVPWVAVGRCDQGRACEAKAECHFGVCWSLPVDGSFIADLSKAPLAVKRLAHTLPLHVWAEEDRLGFTLRQPLPALQPSTLFVARCLAKKGRLPLAASERDERLAFVGTFVTGGERVPRVSLLSPRDGAVLLPADLARVVVRFSERAAERAHEALWLWNRTWGRRGFDLVSRQSCGSHECLVLAPVKPLEAGAWTLRFEDLVSEGGQEFFRGDPQEFSVGDLKDGQSPVVAAEGRVADGCVVVEVRASEAVDVRLSLKEHAVFGWAAQVHFLGLEIAPGEGGVALLEAWDVAGKAAQPQRLEVAPMPPTPLRIVEVLANPLGPEPRQEFVEIANVSARDVDLGGWFVLVGREERAREIPPTLLRAGGRAILASAQYEAAGGEDPALAPLAALVRMERSLSLANAGEMVRLVSVTGAMSSYGGYVDTRKASDGGKSAVRGGRCDLPANWWKSAQLSTPGAPGGAPE